MPITRETSLAIVRAAMSIAVAVVAVLAQSGVVFAHASLTSTIPADGAMLGEAPPRYLLRFSEPVSPLWLTLVKPDGKSVALSQFVLKDRTVEIEAPASLERGTHVLSWRVVSEDGHPVGGSMVFSIGEASAAAPPVEEPVDWTVRVGLWLAKIGLYVGLLLGVGGVFALRVLMPGVDRGRTVIVAALAIGGLGAIMSVGFQGLDALGAPAGRLAEPVVWATGFGTSYGSTVLGAFLAFAIAALGLTLQRLQKGLAVLALFGAGTALALSGHASAAAPQWLMRPMVFTHAVTIAVWVGALIPLGLAIRKHDAAAMPSLRRFSRFIPYAVAVLAAAGLVLSVVQVEQPLALIQTAYGRVFLVKLVLLSALFTLAAVNRWSLTIPAQAGETSAARRLVRSIIGETVVILIILGAVAAWRFTPPPRALAAAAAEPAMAHIHTDKAMADLRIAPGRAGRVTVSAVIMAGDFGALDAKEVAFVFANPAAAIEPFKRRAEKSEDGSWRADDVILPLSGEWTVRIDVLISDFELARLEGRIAIRP